ncbi:hypothetical protein ACIOHE_13115 [Streptomyces sp. NPDC087851]|uniref:hypothetical protein n=1 Tax=Streptomyces sp. NPDC087851 TaxID=3365810 RepID=UPI003816B663
MRAPIGHEAMREVWERTDLHLRRPIALNFIRPELLDSDDERQRIVGRFRVRPPLSPEPTIPIATVHNAGAWKAMQHLVIQLVPGVATAVYSLPTPQILASAPDASSDSFLDPGMDITRPFRFPASPRPPATRVGKRAWGRR